VGGAEVSRRLPPAVFLASAAVLLLELVFTRLFSVVMWYHFASLSVAVALFGFACGGVLVHLRPPLAPEPSRPGRASSGAHPGRRWTSTPPAAKPKSATATESEAKWYHITTENSRVKVSSSSSTAAEARKTAG